MQRAPTLPKRPRARLEAALDRLLDAMHQALAELDALDGDPDAEPSLAAPERHPNPGRYGAPDRGQLRWAQGAADDREEDCEDEGAQCDDEGVCGLHDPDREPDHTHEACHWQDDGDQTTLIPHAVHVWPQTRPSVHQNVGEFVSVRAL